MELRWAERMNTHVPIRLETSDGQAIDAAIHNISVGGFYVETVQPLELHACIDVCVQIPHEDGWSIHRAPAVVAYTTEKGAGLMFSAIDRDMCRALKKLTAGRVPDALRFDGLRSMARPLSRSPFATTAP